MCKLRGLAMMTGVAPYRSGVYANSDNDSRVIANNITMPQYFANHGYKTLSTGKIFHTHRYNPNHCQIDYVARGASWPDEKVANNNVNLNGLSELGRPFDWAARQLQQHHDKPFFLSVGISRPHLPWFVPQKYFDRFPLNTIQLPNGYLRNDRDDLPHTTPGETRNHRIIARNGKWKESNTGDRLVNLARNGQNRSVIENLRSMLPND